MTKTTSVKPEKKTRIFFLDIEASPIEAFTWETVRAFISNEMVQRDSTIFSFAIKEIGEHNVVQHDTRKQEDVFDDKDLLLKLRKQMDQADVIVGHNARRFDIPKINARFILHGIPPPSPYVIVDTLEISRRLFKFTSNKLSYLTEKICTKFKKSSHSEFPGFSLWQECIKKNPKAWKEMKKYNTLDVLSLEELYEKMLPFTIKEAPEPQVCSKCGSSHIQSRGISKTKKGTFARYHCQECKEWTNVAK